VLALHHHGSSACAAKVRFALAEKQLAWHSHYVDILAGEQFAPAFLQLNPKAVVPVLVHDGRVLTESTVICEYIDEAFDGPALLPSEPFARAQVRLWTKWVDEELHPACSALTYTVSHRHTLLRRGMGSFEDFLRQAGHEGLAARTRKWQWIQQGLEAPGAAEQLRLYDAALAKMEGALAGTGWLVGGALTLADIALAPYVNRLHALSLKPMWAEGRRPAVADWFQRLQSRPGFVAAFDRWMPAELAAEMAANGRRSWPAVRELLGL
jgi:ganglioside-induced differentiation-associated protein 1